MKIVHIEDFFHANAGYQLNILAKYMVKLGHEVTIISGEVEKIPDELTNFFGKDNIEESDARYTEEYGVEIIRLPLQAYVSGRAIYTSELDKTIKKLQPDVLYVHGNDTVSGMRYARKVGKVPYAIVMDSHMLAMASKNKLKRYYDQFYRRFITPALVKHQVKVIRTQDDPYVHDALGIPLNQAPWISTGSDTMLFHPNHDVRHTMRAEYGISEDEFVVIYTGKLTEDKGGLVLAEAFKNKFATDKAVTLLAVGNTTGEFGEKVESLFEESANKIVRIPTQPYIDLAKFYQMADLSVFPKQVSLSFYDAQACGLPVISEENNINNERNSHDNGATYAVNDLDDFRTQIEKFANMDEQTYNRYSQNAYEFVKENYNYDDIVQEYMDVIESEYVRFKQSH